MMRTLFTPLFVSLSLLIVGSLSGCGFSPLHTATGATGASAPLANVNVEVRKGSNVIDNQAGFFLAQRLRDRIGVSADTAPYTLHVTPNYYRNQLGLTDGDVASRYDISVAAQWDLVDSATGKSLKTGLSSSIVTFGAPSGPFGVITADSVGVEQSATETADKLIIQLASYFAAENKKSKN